MSFYDFKSKYPRTKIGQKIVEKVTDTVFTTIKPYLKENFSILDIGAGNGEFAERCVKNKFNYTAIEINEIYCQQLINRGIKVIKEYVPPIPCSNEEYDYVHLSHLLEHMTSLEKAIDLIKDIYRVLKPNGYLCIIAPDYLHSPSFFYDGDYSHTFVTTENRVKMLLVDNGYNIVFSKYLMGWKIGWSGWLLSFIGKIYNNYLYWFFLNLIKTKIDSLKFGRTRGSFARSLFILAQKV
ncbi:MAG: class I SAM-dependent methyltransferase [candidate division WOR-3 bacterium]